MEREKHTCGSQTHCITSCIKLSEMIDNGRMKLLFITLSKIKYMGCNVTNRIY